MGIESGGGGGENETKGQEGEESREAQLEATLAQLHQEFANQSKMIQELQNEYEETKRDNKIFFTNSKKLKRQNKELRDKVQAIKIEGLRADLLIACDKAQRGVMSPEGIPIFRSL